MPHPVREIFYRLRDPRLVADTALRALVETWDLISPLEFSVLYRKIRPHTMCSNARLRGLYQGIRHVLRNDVQGDIVECGCARGGSAALMALTLQQLGAHRALWLFDTFQGLPAPTSNDPDYEIASLFTGDCCGTIENVTALFENLCVARNVHFIKGLFQETLPKTSTSVSGIALLHIDGDWYDSVKSCLDNLYDKVTPGGIIQFDDYGYWRGARKAIDEFLMHRGINGCLRRLDYSGRFLLKPGAGHISSAAQ